MRTYHILSLWILFLFGCQTRAKDALENYPDQMGEIAFDPQKDDSAFQLCNENDLVHSRTSLSYEGGRSEIMVISTAMMENAGLKVDYTGYIMAHFLVNCQGQTGRFRLESMDNGFMKDEAPDALMALVNKVVMSLDQWIITKTANLGKDHSKYLNFKFINGKLDAITH